MRGIFTYHKITVNSTSLQQKKMKVAQTSSNWKKVSGITRTTFNASLMYLFYFSFDHSLIFTIFFCQTRQEVNRETCDTNTKMLSTLFHFFNTPQQTITIL